jgi:hypothetical protein
VITERYTFLLLILILLHVRYLEVLSEGLLASLIIV